MSPRAGRSRGRLSPSSRSPPEADRSVSAAAQLRVPPAPWAVPVGRRLVRGLTGPLGQHITERAELLLSELLTNALRHGGLRGRDEIQIRIDLTEDRLRVEVANPGDMFEPSHPPAPRQESGWGLFFVDRFAERWGIDERDGVRVWFEIDTGAADHRLAG